MESVALLAIAVARRLPVGWAAAPHESDEWRDVVRAADGARLRLRLGGWRRDGRVTVAGMWPRYADRTVYYAGERHEITCADSRTADSIARDVLRRLLPGYDAAYAKALAYVRQHDDSGAEARAVAARLALAIGGNVGEDKTRRGDGVRVWPESGYSAIDRVVVHPAYGHGEDYGQPVRVDIRLGGVDPETAARVLELVRDTEAKRADSAVRVAEAPELDDEPEAEPVRLVVAR